MLASYVTLLGVALWWLVATFLFGMRCDETCSDGQRGDYRSGLHWSEYYDSWQWTAQWLCASVVLAGALGLVRAAKRGSWRAAIASSVVGGASYIGWTLW